MLKQFLYVVDLFNRPGNLIIFANKYIRIEKYFIICNVYIYIYCATNQVELNCTEIIVKKKKYYNLHNI